MKYERAELIDLCDLAVVPHEKWNDRDTRSAQVQVAECRALLKAGCDFNVIENDDDLKTDEWTIWLNVAAYTFNSFEYDSGPKMDTFYIPTKLRIDGANGGDWY